MTWKGSFVWLSDRPPQGEAGSTRLGKEGFEEGMGERLTSYSLFFLSIISFLH